MLCNYSTILSNLMYTWRNGRILTCKQYSHLAYASQSLVSRAGRCPDQGIKSTQRLILGAIMMMVMVMRWISSDRLSCIEQNNSRWWCFNECLVTDKPHDCALTIPTGHKPRVPSVQQTYLHNYQFKHGTR